MAKKTIEGVIGLVGTSTSNFIKQISAGSVAHDLALTNGIKFFAGKEGDAIEWDGTQAIEVVIPSVTDIITDPVRLVGTVDASGSGAPESPKNGDLVFIAADCTFASQVCEAGDMAVYTSSDNKWHVIAGENQVSIVGTEVSGVVAHALGKSAQNVINVEGKQLSLAIDYADVRSNVKVVKTAAEYLDVENGTVTVAAKYVGISQADGSTDNITETVSISLPTALASGAVTISDKVLEASNFTFTSGSFPTIAKNTASINITATQNATIAASGEGSFVTDVTAIKGVSFDTTATNVTAGALAYTTGISASTGASFVNGVHVKASDEEAAANFTVWGEATVTTSTFVTGLSTVETASGDVVSSITVGTVSLGEGSDILTGLSKGGNEVLTSVSFGTLGVDSNLSWFVNGLGEGSDVVTDVTVGAVSFVSDSTSSYAGSAVTSASVSNHVLTFNTGSFMTPVALSKASDTITKGGFSWSGVQLSGTGTTTDTFTKGAISQAATTVSFKNVLTDNVTLSQTSTDYVFDKAASTTYTALTGYVALSVSGADVTKNGAVLENKDITAYIPANTIADTLTGGSLPTFAVNAATGTISGTVGTALSTEDKSWLAVAEAKKNIPIAGAWSLIEASTSFSGAIEVAAADSYQLADATVTPADGYVTDVYVDGTTVGTYVEPQVEP